MPLHHSLDDAERVVLIVDREGRRAPTRCAAERSMRAPIAWNVPTHMPAGSLPRMRPMRSRISPAALLVNVTARILRGSTPSTSISRAMRVVSTRVFPEPAPASTSNGPFDVKDSFALRRIESGGELFFEQHRHQ